MYLISCKDPRKQFFKERYSSTRSSLINNVCLHVVFNCINVNVLVMSRCKIKGNLNWINSLIHYWTLCSSNCSWESGWNRDLVHRSCPCTMRNTLYFWFGKTLPLIMELSLQERFLRLATANKVSGSNVVCCTFQHHAKLCVCTKDVSFFLSMCAETYWKR